MSCPFYVSFSGEPFNFLKQFSVICKVWWISTVMILWKKCVTNIINVLDIIWKNVEHGYLSIVVRVQIIIILILCSYFDVVVHRNGARYIFFGFFDIQTVEKSVTNIIIVFDIILKKYRRWTLKHMCNSPNNSFFDFVFLFWGSCPWN